MNFNICYRNHHPSGKKSIFDFISWLYFALKELDYKVTLSNRLCKNSTNLIFDNFYFDTGYLLRKNKIKYGVLCTETPTGNTFNNYKDAYWLNRRKNFDKLIKGAEFVWTTWGVCEELKALHKNYGYLELSFCRLYKEKYKKNINKKFDFAFSGQINDFRKNILKTFEKIGKLKINKEFKSKKFYSSIIEQSNFSLSFQQSLNWQCMPTTKIMNSLHLGTIPIIFKPDYEDSSNLSKFCLKIDGKINDIRFNFKDYEIYINQYEKRKSIHTLKELITKTVPKNYSDNLNFIESNFMGQTCIHLSKKFYFIRNFIFYNKNEKNFQLNDDFSNLGIVIYNKLLIKIIKFYFVTFNKLINKLSNS